MGRHSSPDQWHFYRTVVAWFLPWALIATVAGTAVWIAVDALGGSDLGAQPPISATGDEEPSASPSPTLASTPTPIESPSPAKTKAPKPEPTDVKLITEGVTVQVLNGTTSADADDDMADRLAGLGYQVVSVESASRTYERTTVFWSTDEWREAAEALADRFGWIAGPRPENLSPEVSIHVVVGLDEV